VVIDVLRILMKSIDRINGTEFKIIIKELKCKKGFNDLGNKKLPEKKGCSVLKNFLGDLYWRIQMRRKIFQIS